MIKLTKGGIPQVLVDNGSAWTQAIIDKLALGEELTATEKHRYNHTDIKAALISETQGKCAYCESKVRHVAFGDIEHITPKSADPMRWFEWDNLTFACQICNNKKRDFNGNHDNFVDPYVMNPSDHLHIAGALMFGKPGSDAGRISCHVLDLNRAELIERRSEKLRNLIKQIDLWARTTNPAAKEVLKQDLIDNELNESSEFCAMNRTATLPFMPDIDFD